jgi:hypothetical protein
MITVVVSETNWDNDPIYFIFISWLGFKVGVFKGVYKVNVKSTNFKFRL